MDLGKEYTCQSEESPSDVDEQISESELQIRTQIGEYLSSQYGVLVKVLKCLPARDLKNAAQVCRSWESAAKIILSGHTKLQWLFYRRDRGWNVSPQLATWTALNEQVYFEPQICLCFMTKTGFKDNQKCDNSSVPCPVSGGPPCKKAHSFTHYLESFVGPDCRLMVYPVSGVVSTDQDLSKTWEIECIEKDHGAMSTILFPRMKGVTIVPFSLKRNEQTALYRCHGDGVDIVEKLGLPASEVVQALLIFSGYSVPAQCLSVLLSKLQERQKHKIAVGGAITDKSGVFEGILFCGPNVCAASTILSQAFVEKEQVQQGILELKRCSLPTENSVAFMFACLGRGTMWYDNELGVESSIINKTLPGTPVVGFFGRGEIGTTCLPDLSKEMRHGSSQFWKVWPSMCKLEGRSGADPADDEPPQKVPRRTEHFDVNFSYSTSIVLLSFNTAT